MKRKFLAVFCTALLSAAMLAGCGDADKGADTEQSAGEAKEATEEETEAAGFTDGAEEESQAGTEEEPVQEENIQDVEDTAEEGILDVSQPLSGKHHAEIEVKDYGTIRLELDADTAPISVTNFVKLAQENFYDGLTFHRIMDGFMIQGGDPLGNGTGGSEETIKGEFKENGVENNLSHKRGVISMARANDPDSASSQFFIVQTDSDFLDGQYAAFGNVTEGMEIVDAICKDVTPTDNNGTVPAEEQPVMESVTIVD